MPHPMSARDRETGRTSPARKGYDLETRCPRCWKSGVGHLEGRQKDHSIRLAC